MSQPEAARRVGLSQSRLAQLELGNRRLLLTEAFTLAELYAISLDDLDPRGRSVPPLPRQRRERVDRRLRGSPQSEAGTGQLAGWRTHPRQVTSGCGKAPDS